jgi:hypothetical protein
MTEVTSLLSDAVRKIPHGIRLRSLCVAVLLVFPLFPIQAQAGFVGYYAPDNFTITNTNADGFMTLLDSGSAIVLTGGNNGSGLYGTTDLVILAPAGGVVQFRYLFVTLDIDPNSGATFDDAGYLVGDAFTEFTPLLSPRPVTVSFIVSSGQSFGFRVETRDNTGEPGVVTISDFSAPQPVPESGFGVLMPFLAGAYFAWQRLHSRIHREKAAI